MAEDTTKQLPAPEAQEDDGNWYVPILVFFGGLVAVLLIVLGSQSPGSADNLTVADKQATAADVSVQFTEPQDGAEVPPTFTVSFEAQGIEVEPAGEIRDGAGHFHILIDEPFVEPGVIIPNDDTHRHYGDGSLSTELTLDPGTYTLRLQLADGAHQALEGDQYRDEITITVVEDE